MFLYAPTIHFTTSWCLDIFAIPESTCPPWVIQSSKGSVISCFIKWFIQKFDGLTQVCAATRDVLHLYTKLLDVVDDSPHHVGTVWIKTQHGTYSRTHVCFHVINSLSIQKCISCSTMQAFGLLALYIPQQGHSRIPTLQFTHLFPLKDQHWGKQLITPGHRCWKSCALCVWCLSSNIYCYASFLVLCPIQVVRGEDRHLINVQYAIMSHSHELLVHYGHDM